MRKTLQILILTASALLFFGCHEDLDNKISDLQKEVGELEERVSQLNSNISALSELVSALEKNDHISGVTEFLDEGRKAYRITFTSGSTLVLTSGTDGISPIVSIRFNEEYNAYYWTIQMGPDGTPTWMTNSYGLRVKATGTVPKLKIESGIWWYSFDGTSWNKAGWGPAQGQPGTSVFTTIDTSNPYFVSFIISDFNIFRLPTQLAFDELTAQCNQINTELANYTELVGKIPGDAFVTSVAEFDEDGVKGCRITLESGTVLTIRNGHSSQDSVLLSAKAYTDGKYYWVYRSRSSDAYEWLRYNGAMISVSFEDVTPRIGITDSLGKFYFTISCAGGETELMKDGEGKPVEATGKVVLDFFTAVDLSDLTTVALTMEDGTVVRLPRRREHIPSIINVSLKYPYVTPSTSYTSQLTVYVKDTLSHPDVLPNYAAYQKQSGLKAEAMAVDDGYVTLVETAFFRGTPLAAGEGVAYEILYNICFTTGDAATWDVTRKYRIAFFLTWLDHSVMRVVEFDRSIPATSLILAPETITLAPGATFKLNCSYLPENTTDRLTWSSDNDEVATVTDGVITAVANGSCTITATLGSLQKTCQCTVKP